MEFVQEYAVLRWAVVAAFVFAAVIVVARLAAPGVGAVGGRGYPSDWPPGTPFDDLELARRALPTANPGLRASSHESDASHLMMCLVMLVMLVFPGSANPHVLRGVLTAMTVVFAALLVTRIAQSRTASEGVTPLVALGYHVLAAAAMLWAMSGHGEFGHVSPAGAPAIGLAVLFTIDALATLWVAARGDRHHWLDHPMQGSATLIGPAQTPARLSVAMVPHLVMDLGTAYMLLAAAVS